MSDQPTTIVPDPAEFQMTRDQHRSFLVAQSIAEMSIKVLGLDMGLSVVLSGITREMRRHMSVEDVQRLLRGLADTMPEAAKGDRQD